MKQICRRGGLDFFALSCLVLGAHCLILIVWCVFVVIVVTFKININSFVNMHSKWWRHKQLRVILFKAALIFGVIWQLYGTDCVRIDCVRVSAGLFVDSPSLLSSPSWCLQRALTLMEDPSAQRAIQSCLLLWRGQAASVTPGPLLSSE